MLQSFKWSLSFGLSHQNLVNFSPLSHACHMPCSPHSPWFDLRNNIWWWVLRKNSPFHKIPQCGPFASSP
jgi:hypothetical protein